MAQAARASSRHHDSVLSDPFRFQDFEVPKGSLEEAFLEKACSLRSGSNESNDLFLKRLLPSHNLNATIDELVAKSGRSGQSCGSSSILIVESEFYPNVEELERTREFLSIEEMLAEDKRQEEERLREEEKQRPTEPKPKLLVDKWGFVIEDSDAALPSSVIETKKQREKETNRAEKWVSVISQWNSYSEEKKKKVCYSCLLPALTGTPLVKQFDHQSNSRDALTHTHTHTHTHTLLSPFFLWCVCVSFRSVSTDVR